MKKKFILKFVFVFLFFLIWNLIINVEQNDEIWNYGFAHNIYSGLIPYRDFNMVITPFYPFIMSLLFHIFGSSMLVFHIEMAFIITITCFLLYDLIKEKIYILGIFVIFFSDSLTFPSYNLFLLFLVILLMYLEKKDCNDYLIGIIIGLSILTKQSIGIFFILPSLLYIKSNYKKIIKRVIGLIIPCSIFLFYLLITQSFNQFMDLCFFGLFDFGVENTAKFNMGYIYFLIYVLVNVFLIFKNKSNINNYYALCFSSMMLPLFDVHHVVLSYVILITIFFMSFKFNSRLNYKLIYYVCSIFIGAFMFISYNKGFKIIFPNKVNHFEYRFLRSDSIKFTNDIVGYINKHNDKEYLFVVSGAYYYRLVTDTKMSYLDLINYGNFGYNGSDKIIKLIKKRKSDNTVFVISEQDLSENCQADKGAVKYIMNHGKKIGTVQIYDFYILE